MTRVLTTVAEVRDALAGRSIAFVPTMGALHEGHLSLARIARDHADEVVVSIFVNPTQFGAGEDFDAYPRTLDTDLELLEAAGVEWVFAPAAAEVYPERFPSDGEAGVEGRVEHVTAGPLGAQFEGAARPNHFDGMLTVVLRLFDIVRPQVAVFGQKDAQQLALVRAMVAERNLPIDIIAAPISRESDGLARSSRNRYLTAAQRASAPAIFQALTAASHSLTEGNTARAAIEAGRRRIQAEPELELEYLELVDDTTFEASESGNLLITVVRAGATRLLDNLPVANGIDEFLR